MPGRHAHRKQSEPGFEGRAADLMKYELELDALAPEERDRWILEAQETAKRLLDGFEPRQRTVPPTPIYNATRSVRIWVAAEDGIATCFLIEVSKSGRPPYTDPLDW